MFNQLPKSLISPRTSKLASISFAAFKLKIENPTDEALKIHEIGLFDD